MMVILEITGVETYGSTEDHSLNSYEGNDIKHHDQYLVVRDFHNDF